MSKAVRSTSFARVTSLAGAVVAATSVLDLLTGSVNVSAGWTFLVTALAMTVAALPVMLGQRFPPAAALVGCWLFAVVTTVQVAQADSVVMAINNLVLYPMISCYLGWFFDHRMARVSVVAMFGVSGVAVLASGYLVVFTAWANLALASFFCLEAALYLRAKLDQQLETDPLTGALNRIGFTSRLRRELAHVARTGSPLAVAAIDLDGFKAVNDRFGHAAGDQTLALLVAQLKHSTRENDSIARTGGDEFMLLLPNTALSTARKILQRSRVASTVAWSYGLAEAQPSDTQESLVIRADGDLYLNKKTKEEPAPPEVVPWHSRPSAETAMVGYEKGMDSTAPQPFGLLVIGSGPAGVHAAAAYVEAGGPGQVCLVSADPDAPYERPPLSKAVLAGDEPAEGSPILEDDSVWTQIDRRQGTYIEALDTDRRRARTSDGHELGYDRLIVATGSRPSALPGADPGARVFTLRSLEHARRLIDALEGARSVVVVGSGFIGCEAAVSLAGRGLRTTLVTPEPAPQAARLGDWVGSRTAEWLEAAGVELRTGVKVDGVERPARVRLEGGSVIEADLVLAAVGVTQSQDFLMESGLVVEEGHLAVDEELRTSDPYVWAAGDVARARHAVLGRALSVEHWGDAITMGQLAGNNAAAHGPGGIGTSSRWSDPPGFWSEIGGHTLKYSAWGDGFEEAQVIEHPGGAFTVWYADAHGELVGVLTHDRDDDYDRAAELLGRRASLTQALGATTTGESS